MHNLDTEILFNYLDTTPQTKRRFKYLSCINKDYLLIDSEDNSCTTSQHKLEIRISQ